MLASFTVPLAVILFGSAAWTSGRAMWRPGWLKHNGRERFMSSAVEGLIWSVVRAVPGYISRTRYQTIEDARGT